MKLRAEAHSATAEILEAARHQHGVDFRDVRTELYALTVSVNDRFTEADVRRWSLHPDELVPITLARLHANNPLVREALCERAFRDAEREGVLWTPLIDTLVDVAGADRNFLQITDSEERLRRLHAWVATVDDPQDLVVLARFGSAAIRHAQLEKARTIPESELSHWICSASDAVRVLRNHRIMRRHGPAVLLTIFTLPQRDIRELAPHLEESLTPRILSKTDFMYADRLIDQVIATTNDDLWVVGDTFATLLNYLPQIRPERILELLQHEGGMYHGKLQASLVLHKCAPKTIRPWRLAQERQLVASLVNHPAAPAEVLRKAWSELGPKVALYVLRHPNTPDAVALDVVRSWALWRERLDELPIVLMSPRVILEMLRKHDEAAFAREVLGIYSTNRHLDRKAYHLEVIEQALRIILRESELIDADVTAVERLAGRRALPLTAQLHADLLTTQNSRIRERLITMLGELHKERGTQRVARSRRR